MQELVADWWSKKYNLPSNHELFQERTFFSLLVDFYADYYDRNPLEAHRNEDGFVQFKDTGDDLIDKWEQQIADGHTPDFMEGFTEEQKSALTRLRAKGKSRIPGQTTTFGATDAIAVDHQQRLASKLHPALNGDASKPLLFGSGD